MLVLEQPFGQEPRQLKNLEIIDYRKLNFFDDTSGLVENRYSNKKIKELQLHFEGELGAVGVRTNLTRKYNFYLYNRSLIGGRIVQCIFHLWLPQEKN